MINSLWLVQLMVPFWKRVILSIILGTATYLSGAALLGISAYLIAYAALQPSIAELQIAIVGVRFFGIIRGIFRYLERLVSHSVNLRLLAAIRSWFFQKLEPLSPINLQDIRRGDLLTRAIGDIEALENFYIRVASPPIVAALVIFGVTLFFSRYDFYLAIVVTASLLFCGLVLPGINLRLSGSPSFCLNTEQARLSAEVVEMVQGSAEILINGRAAEKKRSLERTVEQVSRWQNRIVLQNSLVDSANILVAGTCLLGVLGLGVQLVRNQAFTGVDLAVVILVTLASFEAVQPLGQAAQAAQKSLASANRLLSTSTIPAEVREPEAALPFPDEPHIRIIRLSFKYPDAVTPALIDLNLDLPPGRHVAVVGGSGAGKSTLVNLLLRFLEIQDGSIEVNRNPFPLYSPGEIRSRVGFLGQQTYIFADSLRENLFIGNSHASDQDMHSALDKVGLSDWLHGLPDGLNSWMGEGGANLSAGERQRLGVARMLLTDNQVVICDEPTANLDSINEQRIIRLILEISGGKTLLWITHRLVSLEGMDEILVMEAGRVMERGTEQDLLDMNSRYAAMKRIQEQTFEIT